MNKPIITKKEIADVYNGVENDARFVVSYFYNNETDRWIANIFDGETEVNRSHCDPERLWAERWVANQITLLLGHTHPEASTSDE